jgi:hypothetical protein
VGRAEKMRRYIAAALAAVIGLVEMSQPLWACSCFGPRGQKILDQAAAVFSGRALRVEYLEPDREKREPPIRVVFEVREVWKGPVHHSAVVSTVYNKWTCNGYYFKAGEDYLVAAKKLVREDMPGGRYEVEGIFLCGGTRLLSNAKQDLEDLGEGKRPPIGARPNNELQRTRSAQAMEPRR